MVATTEHAKAKATLEQELAWTDQEQRYRRQKAVQETLDAPLYGPWYPAMAHSIQDWKPPTFYEEELKYVHALLTDSLQMAWRDGRLGNQADWFLYCMFELYRVGRNFPEYFRELICKLLRVDFEKISLKDTYTLCGHVDLDSRTSVFLGQSVNFHRIIEWLGFETSWWRARYRRLVALRAKERANTKKKLKKLPGVDAPVEENAVTQIASSVRNRESSRRPQA